MLSGHFSVYPIYMQLFRPEHLIITVAEGKTCLTQVQHDDDDDDDDDAC